MLCLDPVVHCEQISKQLLAPEPHHTALDSLSITASDSPFDLIFVWFRQLELPGLSRDFTLSIVNLSFNQGQVEIPVAPLPQKCRKNDAIETLETEHHKDMVEMYPTAVLQ